MLDIILLRHAESTGNKAGIFQGQLDMDPIDPEFPDVLVGTIAAIGEVQAIYTTDLKRGRLPAESLLRKLQQLYGRSIVYEATPLLRERHLGELENKPYTLVAAVFAEVIQYTYGADTIPAGESKQQIQQRAATVREVYFSNRDNGVVVVISHGVLLKYILDNLDGSYGTVRLLANLQGYHAKLDNNKLVQLQQFPGG